MDTLMESVMENATPTRTVSARMPTTEAQGCLTLRALVSEPFGGTAQLLLDMRRAGLNLRSLQLDVESEEEGTLSLTLELTADQRRDTVIARLARFPVVAAVVALDP